MELDKITQKPIKILETGVALGWSSLAFLHAIQKTNCGSLISIDMPLIDFLGWFETVALVESQFGLHI